jgi:hypothetical protein
VLRLDMTPQGSLRKITIEIDLAKKPGLHNWTTRAKTPKELEPFLVGIEVTHSSPNSTSGENTVVELTGTADALNNFLVNVINVLDDEELKAVALSWAA